MDGVSEKDNVVPPETLSHAAKLELKRAKFLEAREKRKQKIDSIRANHKSTFRFIRSASSGTGRRCCGRG